jgi:F-type H+-transporting ATPase subunit gamma
MATLKQIATRLKSVSNIQKITTSMKMVSAAKFKRAQATLEAIRPVGSALQALSSKGNIAAPEEPSKQLFVAVSSDKGLCGGIHSGLAKAVLNTCRQLPTGSDFQIAAVGDKTRGALARFFPAEFTISANDVGRLPPTFSDASFFAQQLLDSGYEPDNVVIHYNKFKSAISFEVTRVNVPSAEAIGSQSALDVYDDVDAETLQSYQEFNLAANLYFAMVEGQTSEQSARQSAMDSASKNAGEMIESLQLTFNRTRQAVITRELIEIISGAAALD